MKTETISVQLEKSSLDLRTRFKQGNNNLVFFIHGLGCSMNNFSKVFEHPIYKNVSLLCFDLPGYGKSEGDYDFSYSMIDFARVCKALLNNYLNYDLHIVAHSMGGAIGLILTGITDMVSLRIKSFSNLEGNLVEEDCFISKNVHQASFDEFKNTIFPKIKSSLVYGSELQKDLIASSEIAFYRSCISLYQYSTGTSKDHDLLEIFKELKCKKAYFYGERNRGIKALEVIDNIEKIEIGGAGHFMMLDNHEEFYSKLYNFQFLS